MVFAPGPCFEYIWRSATSDFVRSYHGTIIIVFLHYVSKITNFFASHNPLGRTDVHKTRVGSAAATQMGLMPRKDCAFTLNARVGSSCTGCAVDATAVCTSCSHQRADLSAPLSHCVFTYLHVCLLNMLGSHAAVMKSHLCTAKGPLLERCVFIKAQKWRARRRDRKSVV